jgi:hypothetical protein
MSVRNNTRRCNAILISADPDIVKIDDAQRHLDEHDELYWEVGFRIVKEQFSFPLFAFIHIKRGQVEYRATIRDIVPFKREHYEDGALAERVKPEPWRQEWKDNRNNIRNHPWKNALVMTEIVPYSLYTYSLFKTDGARVKVAPESFVRVMLPTSAMSLRVSMQPIQKPTLPERNLEDFVVGQLDAIEPGLRLEERQKSTPAGRIDLLCKDGTGRYVVVELKRAQGTDQVVGQILRYMGWLIETYGAAKVRGMVIVGNEDQRLKYALKAVSNVQVKEFRINFKSPATAAQ